jgi:hypothetical protein
MVKNLLCFLGIHNWYYTRKPMKFRSSLCLKFRKCKNCDKEQYFTNLPVTNCYSPNKWKDI